MVAARRCDAAFVLGLRLLSGTDSAAPPGYRSVLRWLVDGLRYLMLPSGSALVKARQRLGAKPLELLFDRLRGPVAHAAAPGASAFGLRLVAWDGTALDAVYTAADAEAFGVPQGGNPQVRLSALIECGTHALLDAAFDGVIKASEHKSARRVLHALYQGILLLIHADSGGGTPELLTWLTHPGRWLKYSMGFTATDDIGVVIPRLPAGA